MDKWKSSKSTQMHKILLFEKFLYRKIQKVQKVQECKKFYSIRNFIKEKVKKSKNV
jgi:hypothetical protein